MSPAPSMKQSTGSHGVETNNMKVQGEHNTGALKKRGISEKAREENKSAPQRS